MPLRKRESEWQAYGELKESYSEADIADCLVAVQLASLPGGKICHSPLAYLAVAMNEVLAKIQERKVAEAHRNEMLAQREAQARRQAEEGERMRRECEIRSQAFARFVGGGDEAAIVAEICRRQGFPMTTGHVGRMFAVAQWWQALSSEERQLETEDKEASE
jgi:hypothetical protein